MEYWDILFYTDLIFFIFVSMTVLYMGIFAFASIFSQHTDIPKSRKFNRFIILIPGHKNGEATEKTVLSILGQAYPQREFDVTVIADQLGEMSNFRLAQQPVTLLVPNFIKRSRTKSLQLAINNLPRMKIYDIAIVLNPGSLVEPDFLSQVNDAYESAGTKAIQVHCASLNRDTAPARMSAIFEEINNSIFRRGHITLGLSSAIDDTGTAYDFNWFKQNIMETKTSWDEKGMEIRLIRQHIYIDFFDNIMVFQEKHRSAENFNRQHIGWIRSQVSNISRNIGFLPGAIINREYNLIDKILQWMLIPRMILIVIILAMSVIVPFIYFTLAIKWWILFATVMLIFALATPDYLVDDKWDNTFFRVPIVILSTLLAKTPLGPKLKKFVNKKL